MQEAGRLHGARAMQPPWRESSATSRSKVPDQLYTNICNDSRYYTWGNSRVHDKIQNSDFVKLLKSCTYNAITTEKLFRSSLTLIYQHDEVGETTLKRASFEIFYQNSVFRTLISVSRY